MASKKSIFVNNLKKFKSDFTGETKEYAINNALWIFMQRDFKLTQSEWAKGYDEQSAYYGAMFATCLLKANDFDVDFDDVLKNTDVESIGILIMNYTNKLYEDIDKKDLDKDEDKEEEEFPS